MKKMLYVRTHCQEFHSIFGYDKYDGLDAYRGVYAREKVILKCNLAPQIVQDRYLSDENLGYANVFCNVMMGTVYRGNDMAELQNVTSSCIKEFVELDMIFRRKLEEIYHFKYLTAEKPISMFQAISEDFRNSYTEEVKRFLGSLGAIGLTVMYYDGAVVWYAVSDSADTVVSYDGRYRQEVVSNAKTWRYIFDVK